MDELPEDVRAHIAESERLFDAGAPTVTLDEMMRLSRAMREFAGISPAQSLADAGTSAKEIMRQMRAANPRPDADTQLGDTLDFD